MHLVFCNCSFTLTFCFSACVVWKGQLVNKILFKTLHSTQNSVTPQDRSSRLRYQKMRKGMNFHVLREFFK